MAWMRNIRRRFGEWIGGYSAHSQSLSSESGGMWGARQNASGEVITERTSLNISSVFCAVNLISGSLGSMPFVVNRAVTERKRERAKSHPVYKLLHNSPNPEMTSTTFVQAITAQALLWGGGFAEIERTNAGTPLAIWPLMPDRMSRVVGDSTWNYRGDDGSNNKISDADVLHIPGLSLDGRRTYSVVSLAANSLGLAMATERFGASLFGNGAVPGGVMEIPGKPEPAQIERLRTQWKEYHRGGHNLAVLTGGAKWAKVSIPPEDAQFLETREFSIEEVARWFNCPPHKLKDLRRATFTNIEHQNLEYLCDTLLPWILRWEQECNRKLLSADEQDEYYTKLIVAGLLRADTKTTMDTLGVGIDKGIYSPDDAREKLDENPLPDGQGEVYSRPGNMVPAEKFQRMAEGTDDQPDDEQQAVAPDAVPTDDTPSDTPDQSNSAIQLAMKQFALLAFQRITATFEHKRDRIKGDNEKMAEWVASSFDDRVSKTQSEVGRVADIIGSTMAPACSEWDCHIFLVTKRVSEHHVRAWDEGNENACSASAEMLVRELAETAGSLRQCDMNTLLERSLEASGQLPQKHSKQSATLSKCTLKAGATAPNRSRKRSARPVPVQVA